MDKQDLIDALGSYGEESVALEDCGLVIKIKHDTFAENPFEDQDIEGFGIDLSNHRNWRGGEFGEACKFNVARLLEWDAEGVDPEGAPGQLDNWSRCHHWTKVYLYSHSGMTVNTTGFSCPWDSGTAGIAFISKKAFIEQGFHGVKKSTPAAEREELAQKFLKSQVELLDDMLRGNCWEFAIEDAEDGEVLDSCCGFWGDEGRKQAVQKAVDQALEMRKEVPVEKQQTLKVVERAEEMYADSNINIDDDAKVSISDGGCWVQAWVWVPEEEED